jgi:hypothetical protein
MAEIYNRTIVETKAGYVIDSTVGQSFGEEHEPILNSLCGWLKI